MERVATNIRVERAKRNWTLQDLAEKSGVHQATICHIEQGKENGTFKTILKLAEAFGVDIVDLFK